MSAGSLEDTEQSPVAERETAVVGEVMIARMVPAGVKNWREDMVTVGNPC